VFPLWWDMLAMAALSLAIYAWAQRVALPAEAIERLAATVPEEDPEAAEGYERRYEVPASSRTSSPASTM
jgi:hypothetical protein